MQASPEEVDDAIGDLLDWQDSVKSTDEALLNAKKQTIWASTQEPRVPIRGQDPVIARPEVPKQKEAKALQGPKQENDVYARDKTKMKDYYRAWDMVDVDAMEEELDREEREIEDAKRRHFEDMQEQQDNARITGKVEVSNLPETVSDAQRLHLGESEKEKGNEAFYSRDYDEADAYYTRSLHFRRDEPSTWANRALARLKLDNARGALEDCEEALRLNPRHVKALHRKGKALHELRRFEEAVVSFQRALVVSPGNTQINGDLMVSRRQLKVLGPGTADQGESRAVIEEVAAEPAGQSGFTRVQIEEDSDSEDGEDAGEASSAVAPAVKQGGNFVSVQIEEASDSDEDASSAQALASSARPAPVFRKVPIVDVEEGDAPTAAAPAASHGSAQAFRQVRVADSEEEELHAVGLRVDESSRAVPSTALAPTAKAQVAFDDMD